MPQFSIHWKGYPHHRLPRIRVTSPQYDSVSARGYAQFAALEVSQLPYSLALQKARLQHRVRNRRRKCISHRSVGYIVASRRTSQRAKSNVRLSGVEGPLGELEAPVYTNRLSASPLRLSSDLFVSAEPSSNPSVMTNRRDKSTSSTSAAERAENVNLKLPAKSKEQKSTASRQVGAKHDQGVSTERVRKNGTHGRASLYSRTRNYDPRLPVRRKLRPIKSTSNNDDAVSQPQSISMILKPTTKDKQPNSAHLSTQQATRGNISSTSTVTSPQPAQLSGRPPRSPTQLLALMKFSRGLERHLIAQEAVRKAGLSLSSPSTSTLSADTVLEFVPYMAEFQAAGLAITSAEQRRPAVLQSRREVVRMLPNEVGYKGQTPADTTERMSNGSQIELFDGSCGGLHTDTTSSRTTVIAISNCKEPNNIVSYPARTLPTKKVLLPWLRKAQEPSSLSESILPNRMTPNKNAGASSESKCESCATTIIDFSSHSVESKKKQIETDPSPIGLQSIDVRGINTVDEILKSKSKEIVLPVVPARPVRALARPQNYGTDSSKISGNGTVPLDLSTKVGQRYRANPSSSKKEKARPRDDLLSQNNGRTFLIEPTPASGLSVGSFCASPKLLAPQRPPHVKHPEPGNVLETLSPSSPRGQTVSLGSKLNQSPNISIPGQYDFDTPSIFKQALDDVVSSAHSGQEYFANVEMVFANLPTDVQQGSLDPVKRKSAAYKPPTLSSHASTVATVSSLGFAAENETQTTSSTNYSDIRDKDVFKGLQIALAAACNKDLDLWIMKMSGCQVRRFLADLRAFEGLGVNTLADQAKRTAKRRQERDQRMSGHKHGNLQGHEMAPIRQESMERNEKKRPVKSDDSGRRGLLLAQMLGNRDTRADETIRERAFAMGWRNRGVSAGV